MKNSYVVLRDCIIVFVVLDNASCKYRSAPSSNSSESDDRRAVTGREDGLSRRRCMDAIRKSVSGKYLIRAGSRLKISSSVWPTHANAGKQAISHE